MFSLNRRSIHSGTVILEKGEMVRVRAVGQEPPAQDKPIVAAWLLAQRLPKPINRLNLICVFQHTLRTQHLAANCCRKLEQPAGIACRRWGDIPHPRRAVHRRRHDPLAIRTELGGTDRSGVFERLGQGLAGLRIPHPRRVVLRRRHDPLPIRTELG